MSEKQAAVKELINKKAAESGRPDLVTIVDGAIFYCGTPVSQLCSVADELVSLCRIPNPQ